MKIPDLAKLRLPSSPTLSPDGARAVVAATRIDLTEDEYRADLWVVPTDGSAQARQLTRGPRDTTPRWSPDGRWLAFLRTEQGGKPQLHVMPTDGGEPRPVTEHPLGVSGIVWSPDSARVAYVARVPEEGRYGTDPDVPPDKEPPRRITTLKYRQDNLGFTLDRRAHVFVVDVLDEGAEPVQRTSGDFDHADPTWSPDGGRLAFVSARHGSRDTDVASDVFVVPSQPGGSSPEGDGDEVRITDTRGPVSRPAFSPDGRAVFYCGPGTLDVAGRNTGLWVVPADGSAPPRRLSDPEDDDLADLLTGGPAPLLVDEEGVTTVRLHRGATELARWPLEGGAAEPLLSGRRQVQGYARAGGTLVAVVTDATSAGELVTVADGEKVLTDFGEALAASAALRPLEEVTATAPDGYPVHGWVVKPPGPGPFPVLLAIHGGPFTQYGYALFDEAQVYAGGGYAVVLGNPRGSAGYGEAHGRAVVGRFGTVDADDLLALLDAALADPALDGHRVGVMGGSYGGFMAAWLLARTNRFAAGIVERALAAPDSFLGSSDIGPAFVDLYLGTDPEQVAAQNPLARAGRITAPTLVIHSEHDWRCPVEQGQRLYVALKRAGVDAELLLFPGEGHELSRSGLPSHRVARFEAVLDWWSRHLPTA